MFVLNSIMIKDLDLGYQKTIQRCRDKHVVNNKPLNNNAAESHADVCFGWWY